ncbi:tRNA (adenine(58)-N(1))-methyltransferase non-catalytic subunit TRM6 isoform X2 [Pseudonaja textilis]|uniref:tRNA (adenine(58)-N(1))-methyltransferase non-catalytic subunit TRM6 isoform X2 n=1 Tax=Pseudonaja textilis TaxID=8673 RepID=UPI000EA88BA7|nr:tRNA (adenine(58)-N(1))-methyltransferase non-catalytic subunit TRM6 isoform X2 [Pseudonaja textilis]
MTKCPSDQPLFQKRGNKIASAARAFGENRKRAFPELAPVREDFFSFFFFSASSGRVANMEVPPRSPSPHVISEGDWAVLKRDDVFKAVAVVKRRKIVFEKQWFCLDNAIGHVYGTSFEVTSGGSLQPKRTLEEMNPETKEAGTDNRNIIDDGKSQKLTHDDIKALKDKGIKGQEIVQQLIENSTTFRDKTEFAQDKYIKKKKRKYEAVITIIKPSTRILSTMYYAREPGKINYLRYDTLAQMLTWGNVHAGNKMIVMETCAGLVLGAVMERMGGYGSIVQIYPGEGPVRAATSCFGFPKTFFDTLSEFPLSKVASILSGTFSLTSLPSESEEKTPAAEDKNGSGDDKTYDKQKKQEEKKRKLIAAAALLKNKDADGLIVASRFHPTSLLLLLLELVAPSRPFVVYCQFKEPLLECYAKLREKGGVINLRLSETWLRNYQILPDRSHPKLIMSGGGGYLLTGITVKNESINTSDCLDEPSSKKRKLQEHHDASRNT